MPDPSCVIQYRYRTQNHIYPLLRKAESLALGNDLVCSSDIWTAQQGHLRRENMGLLIP